jgi:alpha-beta hydrolase superfamily lysophospholipase
VRDVAAPTAPTGASTRALYFGPPDRPLAGFHHAPAAERDRRCAVVLCPPIGYEHILAYRTLCHLAERLAEAGFHVLRFDYDGAGDSAGSDGDPDRVRAWLASIDAASREARALSGASALALVGLRLGATLAAVAAAKGVAADSLVLWAPVSTGRGYVRELRAHRLLAHPGSADAAPGTGTPEETGDEEADGFLVTRATLAALSALDLGQLPRAPAPRMLVLGRDDLPPDGRLVPHLRALGAEAEERVLPGYSTMMVPTYFARVPGEILSALVEWLTVSYAEPPRPEPWVARLRPARGPESIRVRTPAGGVVHERATRFGPAERLFGILSEPVRPTRDGIPGVVLLNSGSVHRIGPNRMFVTMAREWAARGFPVLRMDLGGIGDSRPADGEAENVLYAPNVVPDVRAALGHLHDILGLERFVLAGHCAGAFAALRTALVDESVQGVVLMNPKAFRWADVQSLDEAPTGILQEWGQLRGVLWTALRRGATWRRAVTGAVSGRWTVRCLARVARVTGQALGARAARAVHITPPRRDALADLEALRARGTDVCLVFDAGSVGLGYLTLHGGRTLGGLLARPRFRVETIEGADHTFTPRRSQVRVIDLVTEHLERRHAGPLSGLAAEGPG